MAAGQVIGESSRLSHLRKLERDALAGKLPISQQELEEIQSELRTLDFTPPKWLAPVFDTYWEIRVTKGHDHPVSHTDLYHWSNVRDMRLDNWAVDAILAFDRAYYKATKDKK